MANDAFPKLWDWNEQPVPRPLLQWTLAPLQPGFYELGFKKGGGRFEPVYGGHADNLQRRFHDHLRGSHNPDVRRDCLRLWYRYRVLRSLAEAKFVEGHFIAAFAYPWNRRNEWVVQDPTLLK